VLYQFLFDEVISSHWQTLIRFNTFFDNLAVAYFFGPPSM